MKRKAIALLRVSTEGQDGPDRGSVPGQRRAAARIAALHDLELIDEVSIQISGARVLEDPRFQRLLERIEDPRVHGVVVTELDRLMRPEDPGYYSIFRRFRDSGTLLYTNAGPKDYARDRLLMTLEAEIAAHERERIVERTRRGREERRRQGRRAEGDGKVGMPRGVRFDRESGTWSYVYPEAAQVREAFGLFLSGVTNLAEIARRTGIADRLSGSGSPSFAVRSLLRQPLYAGIYRVDRRWVRGRPVPRPEHERYEMAVLEPPLVSLEEFEAVQRQLATLRAQRRPRKNPEDSAAVYAGRLDCGRCGAAMWVHEERAGRGQAASYVCARNRRQRALARGQEPCTTGGTSHRKLDPIVSAALEEKLGSEPVLRALLEQAVDAVATHASGSAREVTRKITELHNRRERVKDAYEAGVYGLRDLQKRATAIDGEIGSLERLLATEEEITVDDDLVGDLVQVFATWRDLARQDQRVLLHAYRIRVRIVKLATRKPAVSSIEIGVLGPTPDGVVISKKMKRLGIE